MCLIENKYIGTNFLETIKWFKSINITVKCNKITNK